ncbi:MAG: polyphenol oxidase family protein [Actinomycetota bacterium]
MPGNPAYAGRRVDAPDGGSGGALDVAPVLVDKEAQNRGVMVAFSNRIGGVSAPPFESLNLATSVGDRLEDVTENRCRVAAAAGFEVGALRLSKQVHGRHIRRIERGQGNTGEEADGMITSAPDVVLGLLTADCAAIVLAGEDQIAVLHAGWRGLALGIVDKGISAVGQVWGAWIGPAIGSCCYEVGDDVLDAFRVRGLPVDRRRVDMAEAARAALHQAGVRRVAAMNGCTACDRRYFSHRRDGVTGRQGVFVWMTNHPGG